VNHNVKLVLLLKLIVKLVLNIELTLHQNVQKIASLFIVNVNIKENLLKFAKMMLISMKVVFGKNQSDPFMFLKD